MSYRDDRDADQARIAALEHELASANAKIASLEGREQNALVFASGGALARTGDTAAARQTRWLGAPVALAMSREFDGAFPVDKLEELLGRIRSICSDPGAAEVLRASLTWRANVGRQAGPTTVVHVTIKDGKTTLQVTDRLGALVGGVYGGVGGGVGGGGMMIPILASAAVPVLAPVFFVGWFGGVFLGARAIFKRVARRRAVLVQRLFDALKADIASALVTPGG
jgi:hypothetical protein